LTFDPRLWRLVPGSSGAGRRSDGKDFGADVARILGD
jgi:hypothetical protein